MNGNKYLLEMSTSGTLVCSQVRGTYTNLEDRSKTRAEERMATHQSPQTRKKDLTNPG